MRSARRDGSQLAARQRYDRHDREARIAQQGASTISQVLKQRVEQGHVATTSLMISLRDGPFSDLVPGIAASTRLFSEA
jgi:hypothetical protein